MSFSLRGCTSDSCYHTTELEKKKSKFAFPSYIWPVTYCNPSNPASCETPDLAEWCLVEAATWGSDSFGGNLEGVKNQGGFYTPGTDLLLKVNLPQPVFST